jgi:glycine dehydrogenase subunit 1
MPNSVPAIKEELLAALGIGSVDELFEQIPAEHRIARPLDLPPALTSEATLSRHMRELLNRNTSCGEALSFLGGGCWQHYVPAVCDEIMRRSEFLTPVWGTPSSDHGRNQAWFEFTSQLGELLELDLVALPVYSWGCAAGHAVRMASRLTGRFEVLLPRHMDPERRKVIDNYCEPAEMPSHIRVVEVDRDPASGELDIADLESKLSERTAAVYIENPGYLGQIEAAAADIAALARRNGAETIVGVDPLSLGVIAPPSAYGADIVVGSLQPLGIHMYCGGGLGGFIASRDESRYAFEYPALMISMAETTHGENIFSLALMHQCSYGSREEAKDWTGNSTYLYAIGSAVYMALLGPEGFREVGDLIIRQAHYAAALMGNIPGVRVIPSSGFFKEFVVNFDDTGKSVADINRALLEYDIFGGIDLSGYFPDLGQSALYCVTEMHNGADLRRLATTVAEVCRR